MIQYRKGKLINKYEKNYGLENGIAEDTECAK